MPITAEEFLEFCNRLNKSNEKITGADIATGFGVGFSTGKVDIKAYDPLKRKTEAMTLIS